MKLDPKLEPHRVIKGMWRSAPGDIGGAYNGVISPTGRRLIIIASAGTDPREPEQLLGWEHVSVSLLDRRPLLPSWVEMDFVKRLFWDDEQCVVQFHPPRSSWVNNAPALHLWRRIGGDFPMPPSILVGVKEMGEFKGPGDAKRAQEIVYEQVEKLR